MDAELREKFHSIYSVNFHDGDPVGERYGSKDMTSISNVIDFIDDYVVSFITAYTNKQVEAVLDRLEFQLQDPNNVDFYDEGNNSLMSLDEWLLLERNKIKESK